MRESVPYTKNYSTRSQCLRQSMQDLSAVSYPARSQISTAFPSDRITLISIHRSQIVAACVFMYDGSVSGTFDRRTFRECTQEKLFFL